MFIGRAIVNEHHTGMDITAVSEEIRRFTGGYPYLVSRMCQHIDEKMSADDWTAAGVRAAVREITFESSVLFDDLSKNLENDKYGMEKKRSIMPMNNCWDI